MEDNEEKFNFLAISDECILRLNLSEEIISISKKHIGNYSWADEQFNIDIENSILRYIGRLLAIEPATRKQVYRIKKICKELNVDIPTGVLEDKRKAYAFLKDHIIEE